MAKKVLIALLVVVGVAGVSYLLAMRGSNESAVDAVAEFGDVVIKVTDNGFEPSEATIQVGETVTWQNSSSQRMWPASDIHPTHAVYPEFDPQQGVPVGDSWSFTFDRAGDWRFHDHIRPQFIGVVHVVE